MPTAHRRVRLDSYPRLGADGTDSRGENIHRTDPLLLLSRLPRSRTFLFAKCSFFKWSLSTSTLKSVKSKRRLPILALRFNIRDFLNKFLKNLSKNILKKNIDSIRNLQTQMNEETKILSRNMCHKINAKVNNRCKKKN